MTLTADMEDELKVAMLHHVRYEITHCLIIPAWREDAPMLKEAIFLSFFVHARNLIHFFERERKDPTQDDVYASDYGFPRRDISLAADDRMRFGKDMMHITSRRERHTTITKPWPILQTYSALKPVGYDFSQHIVRNFAPRLSVAERGAWMELSSLLSSPSAQLICTKEEPKLPETTRGK
ncbi:hypothetical protein ESB00_07040 [Oleiharenicola lentus]|jgi:hypothetical protein|uniref:Uncharacterized protein n=1 Tax=Oleiharenicola lentus TaxID=2508720 RepID=A0A4Q1C9S6_9BACT|nr:hypothetical protein [Oleiharenicola lentus]RXK55636.1 hypothetical protein ESB00_07040 [Oleiharenicola lentus]